MGAGSHFPRSNRIFFQTLIHEKRTRKKKKKTNNRCIGERQLSDLHVIVCISTPSYYTFSVGNQNSSECPKEKKIKKNMGEYIIMLNESPCVKARG